MKPVNTPPAPGPRPPAPFLKRLLFRLLRQRPRRRRRLLLLRRRGSGRAHGGGGTRVGAGPPPLRRQAPPGESVADLARAAPGIPRLAYRARACPVHPGAESRCGWRLSCSPRARSWPSTRAWSGITCGCATGSLRLLFLARRAGGPHLPPPALALPVEARPLRRIRSTSASSRAARPSPGRPRVAVLSPYFPYPLSHGGAVRIFNLLREAAREFDIYAVRLHRRTAEPTPRPVAEFCSRIVLVEKPRYREPRWSTLLPPEVHEFRLPRHARRPGALTAASAIRCCKSSTPTWRRTAATSWWSTTSPSTCSGRSARRERSLSAWWDWFRWRRFERRALRRFPHVVVMSEKDSAMLGTRRPSSKTAWTWSASAPCPKRPASACSSSAPSATSPTWPRTGFFAGAGLAAAARPAFPT